MARKAGGPSERRPGRPAQAKPARKEPARRPAGDGKEARTYAHTEEKLLLRPDVGLQPQFRNRRPPKTYRYDPSLDPALSWDVNVDRERGEALIAKIESAAHLAEAQAAAAELRRMSRPFLNWAGKAERQELTVPTLPLFVHERLSTQAILQSLTSHKRDRQQTLALFADEELDVTDRLLKAYEHPSPWVNRLVLGDSLIVMNSLLQYEGLGGQVQMIYMDPPYGVRFGSNFQPFVRRRDVKHGDDSDLTREPEMVQAYRDTWDLGLHSYLTYLRDRLLVCRELLHPSGSIFVQISDENLHHVRELLDEVFGSSNLAAIVVVRKTAAVSSPTAKTNSLPTTCDYILWYARDIERLKYRQLYLPKAAGDIGSGVYSFIEEPHGGRRRMNPEEMQNPGRVPSGCRIFRLVNLTATGWSAALSAPVTFDGREFVLPSNLHWKTLRNIRRPARALSLHAEAEISEPTPEDLAEEAATQKSIDTRRGRPVAFVFGPEHGPVTEQIVFAAAKEANLKSYERLFVVGFAIQPGASKLIQACEQAAGIPATYVQATMDLLMADLETKGYDPAAEAKVAGALRWVAAVNAEGSHGRWAFRLVSTPSDVPAALRSAARELASPPGPSWREALEAFVTAVREAYAGRLDRVVLSRARGEAVEGSDIDTLVVLDRCDDFWAEFDRVKAIATEVSIEHDAVISALPIGREQFEHGQRPLLMNARREGHVVS